MNVRKPVDYSAMFAALDVLMAADLPQMKLYCEIGRLVSDRMEKGAAVAAAEYLQVVYPDAIGFSPRNLRRMREFYRTYEAVPEILAQAMTIGWTQNVIILEAGLTFQERVWYIRVVRQFGWSKLELRQKIASEAHLEIALDFHNEVCYTEENNIKMEQRSAARQLRNSDYDRFDLLIGMDKANLRNMYRICGGDFDGKLHLLMEFTGRPDAEVADPWYTGDFEATWRDVLAGCQGLLRTLREE